jgi:hypothetical protein
MTVGPMQFGAINQAGADTTQLAANTGDGGVTLRVNNFSPNAYSIHGSGGRTGIWGTTGETGDPDLRAGVFGYGLSTAGVLGVTNVGRGVVGQSVVDSPSAAGVYGLGQGRNSNGVIGEAHNGAGAYGVWGRSSQGYAGVFGGTVRVYGTLTKSGGGFRIDHPIDPDTRYLSHSFVESPDMLNVYSGNVETDGNGDAVVRLPEYFESLNEDFRYQLTAVREFAQVIVAQEVRDNQFSIKSDRPSVTVSWQVTGVRRDPFAKANRNVVEEEKPDGERGTYLHPEVYGQSAEQYVDFARERELHDAQPPVTRREF